MASSLLSRITYHAKAKASLWNPLYDYLRGDTTAYRAFAKTNDATEPVLKLQNTGGGPHLLIRKSDDSGDAFRVDDSGISIGGVRQTPTRVFRVSDYGPGLTADSQAAAADNTTAFNAARDAALTAGGGILDVDGGTYWFNQLAILGAAASPQVIVRGAGPWTTSLRFTNVGTDPCLVLGGGGYGVTELRYPFIRDLMVYPDVATSTGYAVQFKDGTHYPTFENVWIYNARQGIAWGESDPTKQLIGPEIRHTRVELDSASTGDCLTIYRGGAGRIMHSQFDSANPSGTTGIRIVPGPGSGGWDTLFVDNCMLIHHRNGLYVAPRGSSALDMPGVAAATFVNTYIDGCTVEAVTLIPGTYGRIQTFQFANCWLFSEQVVVHADGQATGAEVKKLTFSGCYFKEDSGQNAVVANTVSDLAFANNLIGGGAATYDSMLVGNLSGLTVIGNIFTGASPASSGYNLNLSLGCDGFIVANNVFHSSATTGKTTGAISNAVGTSATKVVGTNVTIA